MSVLLAGILVGALVGFAIAKIKVDDKSHMYSEPDVEPGRKDKK